MRPDRSLAERYRRWRVIARGHDAAADLRRVLRANGGGICADCGLSYLASALDVDHVVPLALGGEDVRSNVQPLCRPCHKRKTRVDFGVTAPPF